MSAQSLQLKVMDLNISHQKQKLYSGGQKFGIKIFFVMFLK